MEEVTGRSGWRVVRGAPWDIAGFKAEGGWVSSRSWKRPRNGFFHRTSRKKRGPVGTLISAPKIHCGLLTSRSIRWHVCVVLNHLAHCGHLLTGAIGSQYHQNTKHVVWSSASSQRKPSFSLPPPPQKALQFESYFRPSNREETHLWGLAWVTTQQMGVLEMLNPKLVFFLVSEHIGSLGLSFPCRK